MVCVWLHFSRYQEQARKDIAVVTQRVHRILLDVGKVRCLWINPHLYFFSFPTFIKCSWRILFVTSRFLLFNETWIVWEGFSFTWRARSVCVLVDFWSVSLGTSVNNCTIVLFVFLLLLFAYLLDPLIIFQSTDSISDSEIRLFCK